MRPFIGVTVVRDDEDGDNQWLGEISKVRQSYADVSRTYARAARLACECKHTGSLAIMDSIECPARMSSAERPRAIELGEQRYFVPSNAHASSLLEADLHSLLAVANRRRQSTQDWITIALAATAWDGFQHAMRQMFPMDWMDEQLFAQATARIEEVLGSHTDIEFDRRGFVRIGSCVMHARAHAVSRTNTFLFVWAAALSHAECVRAALVAAIHGKPCTLANLRTGGVKTVCVQSAHEWMERCL